MKIIEVKGNESILKGEGFLGERKFFCSTNKTCYCYAKLANRATLIVT